MSEDLPTRAAFQKIPKTLDVRIKWRTRLLAGVIPIFILVQSLAGHIRTSTYEQQDNNQKTLEIPNCRLLMPVSCVGRSFIETYHFKIGSVETDSIQLVTLL